MRGRRYVTARALAFVCNAHMVSHQLTELKIPSNCTPHANCMSAGSTAICAFSTAVANTSARLSMSACALGRWHAVSVDYNACDVFFIRSWACLFSQPCHTKHTIFTSVQMNTDVWHCRLRCPKAYYLMLVASFVANMLANVVINLNHPTNLHRLAGGL